MNRLFSLLAIICLLAGSVSCKNKKSSNKSAPSTESVQSRETGIDELLAPAGEPQMLCSQEQTSFVSMLDAFENGRAGDYLHEPPSAIVPAPLVAGRIPARLMSAAACFVAGAEGI